MRPYPSIWQIAARRQAAASVPPTAKLTVREASEYLAALGLPLAPGTLNNLRSFGAGPKFSRAGRRIIYRAKDLGEFVEDRAREGE